MFWWVGWRYHFNRIVRATKFEKSDKKKSVGDKLLKKFEKNDYRLSGGMNNSEMIFNDKG